MLDGGFLHTRLGQVIVGEKKVVSIWIPDRLDRHPPMVVTHLGSCSKELRSALGRLAPVQREKQPPASRAKTVPVENDLGAAASDLNRHKGSLLFVAPILNKPKTGVEAKRRLAIGDEEDRTRVPGIDVTGHSTLRHEMASLATA